MQRNLLIHRYAPYPMPASAGAALHATHAHVAQSTNAPQAQAANPQQAHHQQHQAALTAAQTGVSAPVATHNPYQTYGLPNVDMSSFQNVDWSSMYGMGMYV